MSIRIKSFKEREHEKKTAKNSQQVNIDRSEIYSLDKETVSKYKKKRVMGSFHTSIFFLVIIIIVHLFGIIFNIANKTPGMVFPLILGLIVYISVFRIKIDVDSRLRNKIAHNTITTKAIFNYIPFFYNLKNYAKPINSTSIIMFTLMPFLLIWNNFTIVFLFPYVLFMILLFMSLFVSYYNMEYFLIVELIKKALSSLWIGIFILIIAASPVYVFALMYYLILLVLYKLMKPISDKHVESDYYNEEFYDEGGN